jgi:hypothetical protein
MFSILWRASSNKVLWFVILGLVGGYFRMVAIQETRIDRPIRADAQDYYLSAYNLARNGIYSRSLGNLVNPPREIIPDSYRPPGLPLIIALFMDLWPHHDQIMWRVQLVNVALGVVTVLAIFLCAALVLPLPAAVAVGLLTAGSPHLISMTVYILTETPAAFLIALLLALTAIRIPENHRAKSLLFFALGITVGCLSLFRPVYVAFAPAVAVVFPGRQNKVQAAILGCMGAAVIVAPWFIRNFLDVPAGSSPSVVTATILEGAYRGYVFNGIPSTFPYGARHDPLFPLLEKDFIGTLEFVSNKIALDPLGMMKWYFIEKPIYLLQWSNIDGIGDVFVYPIFSSPFRDNALFRAIHQLFYYTHAVVLWLAIFGCVLPWTPIARWLRPELQIVLRMASALLIFHYLIHLPFVNVGRYSVPMLPTIFFLTVSSIVVLLELGRAHLRSGVNRRNL